MKYATVKYCCIICATLETIQYKPTPAGSENVNRIDIMGIISIMDLFIEAAVFVPSAAALVCGEFEPDILLSSHDVKPDKTGISRSGSVVQSCGLTCPVNRLLSGPQTSLG